MAKVKIQGHASGTGVFTLTSPNSNTDRTITLPDADVTLGTDATKLPLAGGALTGNVTSNSKLTINNATVQGALVGVYTGGFDTAGVVAESGIHLANSTAANTVMQMTFGLQSPAQTKAAGYIGFKNTDVTGLTKGDLIFGTRSVVTDTTPTERLRITSDGNVGIGTSSPSTSLHLKDNATAANTKLTVERSSLSYTGEYAASHCGSVTNNEFEIHTNNTLRIKIDSSGRVTMPSQPCVSARAYLGTAIPVNTVTLIPLDSERFDIGNNLASSTFTAPVTGKYLYTYTLYFVDIDNAATSLGVQVVTSNKQYEQWITPDHIANSDFSYTATSSQVADMDANDTLQYKCYTGGGSATAKIHADSMISIALIA